MSVAELILFNKPYRVLSQFSDTAGRATLADYLRAPGFRAAGRLDYDSEGLLLLCADGQLQQRIANPRGRLWKTYWVQVEGVPDGGALEQLRRGVELRDGPTLPARVRPLPPPGLWPRTPPVRFRASVADSWLELSICEGRNRQVRRMTAAVGHPTLRLVRVRIGDWTVEDLRPGAWRRLSVSLPRSRSHTPGRRSSSSRRKPGMNPQAKPARGPRGGKR